MQSSGESWANVSLASDVRDEGVIQRRQAEWGRGGSPGQSLVPEARLGTPGGAPCLQGGRKKGDREGDEPVLWWSQTGVRSFIQVSPFVGKGRARSPDT